MPSTINGFGTSFCGARGYTKWGTETDCDGLECFVLMMIPVIPYKAYHTYNWEGNAYQQIPIRWTTGLYFIALARRLVIACFFLGVMAGIMSFLLYYDHFKIGRVWNTAPLIALPAATVVCFVAGGLGNWVMGVLDRRASSIRYVLGRHSLGSSDPATWTKKLLEGVESPHNMFGTPTFAEAVDVAVKKGDYSKAMWAARLSTVLEDKLEGENYTDSLLGMPEIQEALQQVLRDPRCWSEVMTGEPPPFVEPVAE